MKIHSLPNNDKKIFTKDISIYSPFDNKIIAEIEFISGQLEIKKFKDTLKIDKQRLSEIIRKLTIFIKKERYKLAKIISEESGSPIKYNLHDIDLIIDFLADEKILNLSDDPIYKIEPKGNVLINLSANEPIIIGTIPLINALISGNNVFVKPSSKSPIFSFILCKKLLELGVPESQLYYLLLKKDSFYKFVEANPIDYILSFGSLKTNKEIGSSLTKIGINNDLENEGNDWIYVEENEFNTDELVDLLVDSFTKHNGQMCDSVKGIFIKDSLFNKYLKKIKLAVLKLRIGNPINEAVSIGAINHNIADYIIDFIENDKNNYRDVYNYKYNDNILAPTLLIDPNKKAKIYQESLFGPVCFIKSVKNIDEVISIFDDFNVFGLGFSVISMNDETITKCIKDFPVARININIDPTVISYSSPWGGIGQSGTIGPSTWIEKFTRKKLINYGQF